MTSNIVAFESAGFQLPAFLQNSEGSNSDLTAHQSQSFPVLSIKGKVFSIVRGTERQIVPNPKDPESPATRLPMIIVKANKNKAKSYYASAFKEGAEDVKPTCFSNDGIRPDPQAEHPQCTSCAKCKWNVFGTARGDNGAGKGKACADAVRVAVVPATGPFTEAYLLRVPPASIKALGEFGSFCEKRKIPHQAVVCELSFDQEQATPRLVFTPKGIVGDQATYNQIMELAKSDEVQMIIGAVSANEVVENNQGKEAAWEEQPKEEAKAAPASVSETAEKIIAEVMTPQPKKAKVTEGDDLANALDGLGFDD